MNSADAWQSFDEHILRRRMMRWSSQDFSGDGYDAVRQFLSDPETTKYFQGRKKVINGPYLLLLKELSKIKQLTTPTDDLSLDEIGFAIRLGEEIMKQLKSKRLRLAAYTPPLSIVGSFNSSKS
jgi:hypothetical protein